VVRARTQDASGTATHAEITAQSRRDSPTLYKILKTCGE
jgi:hypothetical protein